MVRFNFLVILGGLLGYAVAIVASTALVLLFFRLNARMLPGRKVMALFQWDRKTTEKPPSPAPAIALGAATLSQAYLLRHAVFVIMALLQDFLLAQGNRLFLGDLPVLAFLKLAGLAVLILAILSALAVLSIWIAGFFFDWMTGELKEMDEIMNGNVPIAILFTFVLFAVTVILDQGIEDVSRALIPDSGSGAVRLP